MTLSSLKIATIVGARPQFIKAAPVSRALRRQLEITEKMIHTGQHYDPSMSELFFQEMAIPAPDYHLNIGSGRHGVQTGRMLSAIEEILLKDKPDWVLVYGDTNSTLAGALAAVKLHIPVAHVEAGLRSFNRKMPEEINRVLTDHMADLLLTPTETADAHLLREGIPASKIQRVGDVMYDAALYYGDLAKSTNTILQRLGLTPGGYVLATIHRAENTDDPGRLAAIVQGLAEVHQQIPVVWPMHPRTRAAAEALGLLANMALHRIDPVGYFDMVMLEQQARLIATDSGGVQKEAFFYRVPCVTLRDETEWVELIHLGWNRLLPPGQAEAIRSGILAAMDCRGQDGQPYGDGQAAEKIVDGLLRGGQP